MKQARRSPPRGYTMVEVMIVTGIISVMATVLATVNKTSLSLYQDASAQSDLDMRAQNLVDQMANDIKDSSTNKIILQSATVQNTSPTVPAVSISFNKCIPPATPSLVPVFDAGWKYQLDQGRTFTQSNGNTLYLWTLSLYQWNGAAWVLYTQLADNVQNLVFTETQFPSQVTPTTVTQTSIYIQLTLARMDYLAEQGKSTSDDVELSTTAETTVLVQNVK
ncbi:MAG: prepilin-type N-terminal cleavage/methylation domain-containing protein [Planctomycetota bacterium]